MQTLSILSVLVEVSSAALKYGSISQDKEPLKIIVTRLPQFVTCLKNPPVTMSITTTFGVLDPPLGETRLKLVDFVSTLFKKSDPIEQELISSGILTVITVSCMIQ